MNSKSENRIPARLTCALVSAVIIVNAGFAPLPAACQVIAALHGKPGLAAWTPPFPAASEGTVIALQRLLDTPSGSALKASVPSLGVLRSLSFPCEPDRQAIGALSSMLPVDFEARVMTALLTPEASAAALTGLAQEVAAAHAAAVPLARQAVLERVRQVASAADGLDEKRLKKAAKELGPYRLYGEDVQALVVEVERLALAANNDAAMALAIELARRLSVDKPEEAVAADAGQASPGKPEARLQPSFPRGGLLPDEDLHLTPAHYENARRFFSERFSLAPMVPVEPVLVATGEKTGFQVGDEVSLGIGFLYGDKDPALTAIS
ncbi:MAG: hypothetical protein WC943_08580 [Elusimicrobiota bacterium]|jgi:hypothetical protein